MRIHELLNEARTIHLDPDEVMSVKVPIRVWANPRHVEMLEWLKTGDLRGLITPTSLFVFDAWILAHDVVMDGLIETGEIPMAQSGDVVRCDLGGQRFFAIRYMGERQRKSRDSEWYLDGHRRPTGSLFLPEREKSFWNQTIHHGLRLTIFVARTTKLV